MGWSIGYDSAWQRDIGYGVPATCDAPGCGASIDRGLAYVCGNEPYGGDKGCGLFFCDKHQVGRWQRCTRCTNYRTPYKATPDVREWIEHKLTDESWGRWRDENPKQVAELRAHLNDSARQVAQGSQAQGAPTVNPAREDHRPDEQDTPQLSNVRSA